MKKKKERNESDITTLRECKEETLPSVGSIWELNPQLP